MKNILILGAGKMGMAIASDLRKDFIVDVLDNNTKAYPDVLFNMIEKSEKEIVELFNKYDLIIGALPSHIGFKPIKIAVEHGFNYVDLSFTKQDISELHSTALKNNSIVFHDCGLSPGLSNLLVGYLRSIYDPSEINIWVGGISQNPNFPYGHVNTWCVEDLLEEYTRPARLIIDGREELIKPLNNEYWKQIYIDGVGNLDAFLSDGLRSLLNWKLDIPNIAEYTLRRPGHLCDIEPLIKNETFIQTIKEKCSSVDEKDVVILRVDCGELTSITMIDYATDDLSAMARTTAFSCAAFARLILNNMWISPGVYPPEDIALDIESYNFIINYLKNYNILFDFKELDINDFFY